MGWPIKPRQQFAFKGQIMNMGLYFFIVIGFIIIFPYSLIMIMVHSKNEERKKSYKGLATLSSALLVGAIVFDNLSSRINPLQPSTDSQSNQVKTVDASDPTNEDEARKVMVGVWTYTQPIANSEKAFPFEWIKVSISDDGTMVSYFARPVDDGWGNGVKTTYKIITGKYADTGERWFGISDGKTTYRYTYMNGKLFVRHFSYQSVGVLERGDKHPFSK